MSKLREIIREALNKELDELARISTNIKVGDETKFSSAKKLYAGTWVGDLLDYVEQSGASGIPQPDLAEKLGKSGMQAINPKIRNFLDTGILSKGEYSVAKKEKPEPSGAQRGRPVAEKTKIAVALDAKFKENPDYEPSQEEIDALGEEFINKLKLRAKGELKRGRKLGSTNKPKDEVPSEPKSDVLEEKEEEEESFVYENKDKKEPLNESYVRMQKLAGLIK